MNNMTFQLNPLNRVWLCDLLWPIECSRRNVPVVGIDLRGLDTSLSWKPVQPLGEQALAEPLENERPCGAKPTLPAEAIPKQPIARQPGSSSQTHE